MNKFISIGSVISIINYFGRSLKCDNRIFTMDEVEKHDNLDDLWVTYGKNVYDVTKFAKHHPGGTDKILMAAGGRIDPYWNIYKIHDNKDISNILDKYLIGELDKEDIEEDNIDPYENDIINNNLIIHKNKPFNGEPSLKKLRENYLTPINLWYSRNHHPMPNIDIKDYKLFINDKTLKFKDLGKFKENSVITTIQCAGNKRNNFKNVLGLSWKGGAISTAKWTGIYLADILNELKIDKSKKYIHFVGDDIPFDCSIKLSHVLERKNEVLLAYKMNDKPLPKQHGYPLRVIIPGFTGAKNVKWITNINISNEESYSTWQRGIAYKKLPEHVKKIEDITENMKKIKTIEVLPVQSIIMDRKDNVVLGCAYSGGGNKIIKVQVSNDMKKWYDAKITEGKNQEYGKSWAWVFWKANIKGDIIYSRAIDEKGNIQPKKSQWNIRGILNNDYGLIR